MIWVSWRQHRSEAFGCLAVLAGLAIYAIVVGTSMRTAFGRDGISVDQVRREATAPA
jgi:drug/metabolite transporter superfamily protein YnfA